MSYTLHYCESTLCQITQAVAHLGGILEEIKPILDYQRFKLTWLDAEDHDKLYVVDLWVKDREKEGVSVWEDCYEGCYNGQSNLSDHLSTLGIEATYYD